MPMRHALSECPSLVPGISTLEDSHSPRHNVSVILSFRGPFMKEKDAIVNCKEHQLVLYVEKKDGSYGTVRTGSYLTKHYVDDFWEKREKLEREYLEKIKNGAATPIEMHMVMEELTPAELAARAKIPQRRVKRHLDPATFATVSVEELRRYSVVFDVPFQSLLQAYVVAGAGVSLTVLATENPNFGMIKIARTGK